MPLRLWRRSDGRSGNWYVMGTVPKWRDGRLCQVSIKPKSTRTPDKVEAEAILLQIAGKYQRGNIENRDTPALVADLINSYLDAGKSDRYMVPVIRALGDLEVATLTQAKIDEEGRKAYPNVAPPTLRRQWHGVINAVLHHSKVHLDLELPEASRSTTRWCFPAQAEAIIRQCAAGRFKDPWKPALAEMYFGAGVRADEAFLLDDADLSLEYGTAVIRDPKNGYERTAFLPARTVAALARLPNIGEPGPVFRKGNGKAYAAKTGNEGRSLTFLRSAAGRAGVAVFNPHMTRHTWATWFYCQTKDPLRLKQLGGWRTDVAMQRYTHLVPMKVGLDAIALGWDFRERMFEGPAEERRQA
jgi:integrase